jgi:hypothetical protein
MGRHESLCWACSSVGGLVWLLHFYLDRPANECWATFAFAFLAFLAAGTQAVIRETAS